MANTAALADIVALTVKAALAPLRERIAVLETRAAVPGPPGPAGADGANGTNGADGLGLDQLRAVQDPADPRVVTLQAVRGDEIKTLSTLRFAIPQFCGAYKGDRTYQPGDQVQQNGLWICETAQPGRPGAPESGWRLQVKGTL
jgi:hypothetical protein